MTDATPTVRTPTLYIPPRLMSISEAAHYTSNSESKFRILMKLGRMPQPSHRFGRSVRWDRLDLDAAIARNRLGEPDGEGPDGEDSIAAKIAAMSNGRAAK